MAILQRGEAERVILAGILLVADADESRLEELDHGAEHLATRETGAPEISGDGPSQAGKCASEVDQARVLRAVALLPPIRMIAVLLAASGVPSRRLEVPAGVGADPDVSPG